MNDTQTRMAEHLGRALADADQTVVLASLDSRGGMTRQARTVRVQDLVMLAQSLLSEAADTMDEIEQPTPEQEDTLDLLRDVLSLLPDPHADEDAAP